MKIVSETLDWMRPGMVPVRAPVIGGVIQVDCFDPSVARTQLEVTVEGPEHSAPELISITREDSELVQVQDTISKRFALASPVAEVALVRAGDGIWVPEQADFINDEKVFESFVHRLGSFALRKQEKLLADAAVALLSSRP